EPGEGENGDWADRLADGERMEQERAGDRRHRGKEIGSLAGEPVGHRAAVREPGGVDPERVDVGVALDVGNDGPHEADVVQAAGGRRPAARAGVPAPLGPRWIVALGVRDDEPDGVGELLEAREALLLGWIARPAVEVEDERHLVAAVVARGNMDVVVPGQVLELDLDARRVARRPGEDAMRSEDQDGECERDRRPAETRIVAHVPAPIALHSSSWARGRPSGNASARVGSGGVLHECLRGRAAWAGETTLVTCASSSEKAR